MNKKSYKYLELLLKKEYGSSNVIGVVPIMILLVFSMIIMFYYSNIYLYIDALTKIENLCQKELIIMQSTGGLTSQNANIIYYELNKLGIIDDNIDLSGTTFATDNVNYGDEIVLSLSCLMPFEAINVSSKGMNKNTEWKQIKIQKSSIALN